MFYDGNSRAFSSLRMLLKQNHRLYWNCHTVYLPGMVFNAFFFIVLRTFCSYSTRKLLPCGFRRIHIVFVGLEWSSVGFAWSFSYFPTFWLFRYAFPRTWSFSGPWYRDLIHLWLWYFNPVRRTLVSIDFVIIAFCNSSTSFKWIFLCFYSLHCLRSLAGIFLILRTTRWVSAGWYYANRVPTQRTANFAGKVGKIQLCTCSNLCSFLQQYLNGKQTCAKDIMYQTLRFCFFRFPAWKNRLTASFSPTKHEHKKDWFCVLAQNDFYWYFLKWPQQKMAR